MTAKRILIIDDEDGIREIVQVMLHVVAGWEVLTAASGSEGIARASDECPDAILLDLRMPEMDGIETFHKLRATDATQSIPTILLTAQNQPEESRRLVSMGFNGFIAKPFTAKDLALQICRILQWSL